MADADDAMLFDCAQDRVLMTGAGKLAGLTNKDSARKNLGLERLATLNKAYIANETKGTLPLNRGGTGETTQAAARTGLGISAAQVVIDRLNAAVAHNGTTWSTGPATAGGLPSPYADCGCDCRKGHDGRAVGCRRGPEATAA